ncbi:MAG TPA: FAD-dependent oxidoreductase [Pseudonocardiaceae bacterium]|nr:FAD-dependent oxidoreductase [Pseudonocardiaceae bacterium]
MPESVDLIVLGAGPAGLAAAWRAGRAGLSTLVLERAPAAGGMAASFTVGGVRVDHGSHRLHPATAPGILADLRRLLGDDLQERRRHGRLRVAGRWVGFPLAASELARALPPPMLARIGAEALAEPVRRLRPGSPASYADALRRGLGPTLYEALYAPFAVKLWGLPGEAIDPEQARVRVSADSPWKIARRLLRRGETGPGRSFHYPRRGFGQIVEALADAATGAGADLRLGTEVTRLTAGDGGVEVSTADGATFTAGHLFTTIPMPSLARIASPPAPSGAVESAARLGFRAMVLVYVVLDGVRPWSEFDATYLPDPGTPITRISEPPNYRSSADDPADRTVLCCELPCDPDDRWWSAPDADLGELVTDTAARLGLPPVRPALVHVRRLRHVYPVYRIGYAEHLKALDTWAATIPHVTTFGRLGLFAHDNTHHAIAMAYDAVDAIAGGRWDAQAWSASRRRFAAHVVED